jgi:hypothetical protein
MDPKKRLKFQELKKRYGFDVAVLKQDPENKGISEEELYKSLLLFHIQNVLVDEINDYSEAVEFSDKEMASLVTMLFNTSGEILSNVARQNPAYLLLCRKIAIEQFDSHIKDFLNGTKSTTDS